jgi:hypothetical protein
MFSKQTYVERRQLLKKKVGSGLILLFGNNESSANYPGNVYKFRQDSCFLYYFGLQRDGLVGVIDVDNDKEYHRGQRHRHRGHRMVRFRRQCSRSGPTGRCSQQRPYGTAQDHGRQSQS